MTENLNTSKRLLERAENAERWADQLASVLFLALTDSLSHEVECSGILADYRRWVTEGRP